MRVGGLVWLFALIGDLAHLLVVGPVGLFGVFDDGISARPIAQLSSSWPEESVLTIDGVKERNTR